MLYLQRLGEPVAEFVAAVGDAVARRPSRAQVTSIRDPDQGLSRSSGWYAEIRSARPEISLHSDAIHESILVYAYGRSKRHFYLDRSLELTVGLPPPAKPSHHQS